VILAISITISGRCPSRLAAASARCALVHLPSPHAQHEFKRDNFKQRILRTLNLEDTPRIFRAFAIERSGGVSIPATMRRLLRRSTLLQGNRKIASRALLCCSSPQMTLTQPGCAMERSVIKFRNLLEGVQYVRSEWRQIKVPPRAQAKYRSQEADARIASCREQEIEANRCSSFREANCGTGMNSRARFRRTPARKQCGACHCHEILRDGRRSAARP
jgi:hypothetical protein